MWLLMHLIYHYELHDVMLPLCVMNSGDFTSPLSLMACYHKLKQCLQQ